VSLQEIHDFQPEESKDNIEIIKNGLLNQVFSQLNPFSQYVLEEIVTDQVNKVDDINVKKEPEEEEARIWNLHEDIFRHQQLNPDHLKKTSAQMFAVYKYYGDPTMKVKNKKYTGTDEYVEVKSLVKDKKFFDAPKVQLQQEAQIESH
jgi:hypothetical protein